ncbi:MAG: hypothetical protein LBT40_14130 [Deltaproteobacteria bacterium]|nr:hypothetical protein [Deltaproteobacteria bacterium]
MPAPRQARTSASLSPGPAPFSLAGPNGLPPPGGRPPPPRGTGGAHPPSRAKI